MIYPDLTSLIYICNLIALFNTIFIIYLFIRFHQNYSPANKWLAYFLTCMGLVNVVILLVESNYILYVPWLYRLPSPLYYMMYPAIYFYVRMTLKDQTRLKKWDLLHFVPALAHLAEMTPYYLKTNAYKIQHIIDVSKNNMGTYSHNEGMLPPYLHNIFRAIQGLAYGILMLILIYRANRYHKKILLQYPGMKNWLTLISVLVTLQGLSVFSTLIGGWATPKIRSLNMALWLGGVQLIITIRLLSTPFLLYGMPRLYRIIGLQKAALPVEKEELQNQFAEISRTEELEDIYSDEVENEIDPAWWVEKYGKILEQFSFNSESYLRPRFSIDDMARELSIPRHHLSFTLNKAYNIRFNDFINKLRIEYITQKVRDTDALKSMTMEGLAKEAGFSSRITFIRAVQRITGQNPSNFFIKEMQES